MDTFLIIYRTRCVPNGHVFEYLGPAEDSYEIITASNCNQTEMVLAPTSNATWQEIKLLRDQLSDEVMLSRGVIFEFFDLILAATLDPPLSGGKWYLWGHIPCPMCGAENQALIGPAEHACGQHRDLQFATQDRWKSLSAAEKEAIARSLLLKFKKDWYFVPDPRWAPPKRKSKPGEA
jgi:hypothetical protein